MLNVKKKKTYSDIDMHTCMYAHISTAHFKNDFTNIFIYMPVYVFYYSLFLVLFLFLLFAGAVVVVS